MGELPALDAEKLSFAYKYPFSAEAKEIIKQLSSMKYEERFTTAALLRVNEDLERPKVDFTFTNYEDLMLTYLLSYVYSRMLVSATGNQYIIKKFVAAEADRAASALGLDSLENVARLSKELGTGIVLEDSKASIPVFEFLKIAKGVEGLHLQEMSLKNGLVELSKEQIIALIKGGIQAEISKGLPIDKALLPNEILSAAHGIKLPEIKLPKTTDTGKYAWIERLLATPIPDVRHRSVNLILAPYLTNIRGLDPDAAANIIIDYIEKCKQLNPNTRVNDAYIKYQCRYAKEHGLRPLSLAKAKELFKGILDL
ncbi:MAG: DNA primase noncatalytic subunit PriX [Candidatus Micrarchaeia archaeon]